MTRPNAGSASAVRDVPSIHPTGSATAATMTAASKMGAKRRVADGDAAATVPDDASTGTAASVSSINPRVADVSEPGADVFLQQRRSSS